MNQRTVAISIIAAFATCFVGSMGAAIVSFATRHEEPPAQEVAPEGTEGTTAKQAPKADEPPPFVAPQVATAQFALFHLQPLKEPLFKTAMRQVRGTHLAVYQDHHPEGAAPPYLVLRESAASAYEVVSDFTLEHSRGLGPGDKKALQLASTVTVIDVTLPLHDASLLDVSRLVGRLAQSTGHIVWDNEAGGFLSLPEWRSRRVASWQKNLPEVLLHFTVFVDSTEYGNTLETAGLSHFGQPELEMQGVPKRATRSMVSLINAIAQLAVESGESLAPLERTFKLHDIRHRAQRKLALENCFPNAQNQVTVRFTPVFKEGKHWLRLSFLEGETPAEQAWFGITSLFGTGSVTDIGAYDDARVEIAKEQLRLYRSTIKRRFRKGLKYGEALYVKAPFQTPNGQPEWMWVEVQKLGTRGRIEGTLISLPQKTPQLRLGSSVTVQEAELFDWALRQADGTSLGGATEDDE